MLEDRVSLTLRPKNLKSETLSTASFLMSRAEWSGIDLLQSIMITLVSFSPFFHLSLISRLVAVCLQPPNCGTGRFIGIFTASIVVRYTGIITSKTPKVTFVQLQVALYPVARILLVRL